MSSSNKYVFKYNREKETKFKMPTLKIFVTASCMTAFLQFSSVVCTDRLCSVIPNENGAFGLVTVSSYLMCISFIVNWTFLMICVTNFSTKVSSNLFSSKNHCEISLEFQVFYCRKLSF